MDQFGEFVRQKRISSGFTLREFCRKKGQETAYISRLETGLFNPPENEEKLEALAQAYEIKRDTREWVTFFDLAAASQTKVPKNLSEKNQNITQFLPAFYRTARKKNITKTDIEKLLELIKGEDADDSGEHTS